MFERPVLIYSNYCEHSQRFINTLLKVPQMFEAFVRINIDINPETNTRNPVFYEIQNILQHKITEVPTIIVDNGSYVLSGEESFKWVDYHINKGNNKNNSSSIDGGGVSSDGDINNDNIEGFNSVEMGSFSDMYANYGSGDMNDAKSQSFQFLDRTSMKIETPPEDGSTDFKAQDVYKAREQEREIVKVDPRDMFIKNIGNNVSKYQSTKGKNNKQDDMDKKLKQLLAEREQFGNVSKPPPGMYR